MGKIAHLALVVKDCERSKDFYCRLFDAHEVNRMTSAEARFIYVQTDGLLLELLEYRTDDKPRMAGVIDHIALIVNDLAAAVASLKGQGIKFETEAPRTTGTGKKIIFMAGPDGERIELMEI